VAGLAVPRQSVGWLGSVWETRQRSVTAVQLGRWWQLQLHVTSGHGRHGAYPAPHTHTRLTALVRDYPGESVPERWNQSGFYWSKRQWVAVASAGPYACQHLAPDWQPRQHPTTRFLLAWCPSCRPTNSVKALNPTAPHLLKKIWSTQFGSCMGGGIVDLQKDFWDKH